jgi:hypothetical protein
MIDASEFTAAGFTPAQADALVAAFLKVDNASAQRFLLLHETMIRGFADLQVGLDRIRTELVDIRADVQRLANQP